MLDLANLATYPAGLRKQIEDRLDQIEMDTRDGRHERAEEMRQELRRWHDAMVAILAPAKRRR